MAELFSSSASIPQDHKPLADLLRPQTLEDLAGQDHLTGKDGALTKLIKANFMPSLILWGPPGCGKTTLAKLIAKQLRYRFQTLSAVFSGVADLKKTFQEAEISATNGEKTLLFVDEIHRFNKAQQDSFLPFVENGTITLIGATTENPSFALNSALMSRCQVLILNPLDDKALAQILKRAEIEIGKPLPLTKNAKENLIEMADGDGRYMLNLTEQLWQSNLKENLDENGLANFLNKRVKLYDKSGEQHYNLISALHKSMRGSDPDAALYWFARMLEGGEDPRYIARRLVRFAAEDIGLASPFALTHAISCWETYERLGSPEGELALANCVIYLATAPKSNAIYTAYSASRKLAQQTGSLPPPKHILNAPTKFMADIGYGEGYEYDHDAQEGFSGQNYFPDTLKSRPTLYSPKGVGQEADIKKRLDEWAKKRNTKKK